jgi:hypothetical protein
MFHAGEDSLDGLLLDLLTMKILAVSHIFCSESCESHLRFNHDWIRDAKVSVAQEFARAERRKDI